MSWWRRAVRAGALSIIGVAALAAPGGAVAQPGPNTRPVGGVVVGGGATITQGVSNTQVRQTTQRAAIDWQSADIGSQQTLTLRVPSAHALTLMTVLGANPSEIAGRVTSNGEVIIVNQSGVTLYKGSQVNASGLVLSVPAANTTAFMAGGSIDFGQAGRPNAAIVNGGSVAITGSGLAAFIGPDVANRGRMTARLGQVSLDAAEAAIVHVAGGSLTGVALTRAIATAPNGSRPPVAQAGTMMANGGAIQLRADAVSGIVTNLISASGVTRADTVAARPGTLTLEGDGGSIVASGQLQARGTTPGTLGGNIALQSTNAVTVGGAALANVSGAAGGGTIAIGTTLARAQGGPSVTSAQTSLNVTVKSGASVKSNATAAGNGGRVAILSSQATRMAGSVSAKGGPMSGNGGFVEISGQALGLTGTVDVTAPSGTVGTLLLDPEVWLH